MNETLLAHVPVVVHVNRKVHMEILADVHVRVYVLGLGFVHVLIPVVVGA